MIADGAVKFECTLFGGRKCNTSGRTAQYLTHAEIIDCKRMEPTIIKFNRKGLVQLGGDGIRPEIEITSVHVHGERNDRRVGRQWCWHFLLTQVRPNDHFGLY